MKRLIEEAFTVDNAGHLGLWVIVFSMIYFLPTYISAPLIATLWLFNREKLQWSCHIGDWDFRLGFPWQEPRWSMHKNFEWIVPSIFGCLFFLSVLYLSS